MLVDDRGYQPGAQMSMVDGTPPMLSTVPFGVAIAYMSLDPIHH